MLKVWGRASSSNVQKVMWAVTEIGLPVEVVWHDTGQGNALYRFRPTGG